MKRYILIGGIGSGKSTVSALFAQKGACCIDMDRIGHRVLHLPQIKDDIRTVFGSGVFSSDGEIDRSALAAAAFCSPADTEQLNHITHPSILGLTEAALDECEASGYPAAIIELSVYSGPEDHFAPLIRRADGIIAVIAPEQVRIERAVLSGFDEDDVRNRIARQATDEQRREWADFVIENGGTLEQLEQQVEEVYNIARAQ